MQAEIQTIKEFFDSNYIKYADDWLQSCVSWAKNEILQNHYSSSQLKRLIYEQWLLVDLRELCISTLDVEIRSKKCIVINTTIIVQVIRIVDISKSKLSQLQTIRNPKAQANLQVDHGEQDIQPVSKRVLKLTLTDGGQEFDALEHYPIQCLSLGLPPGTKIKLKGPLCVRIGQIMLNSNNVVLLGGCVVDLVVPNSTENVLASYLGLPVTASPREIEEKTLIVEQRIVPSIQDVNMDNERRGSKHDCSLPLETVRQPDMQSMGSNTSTTIQTQSASPLNTDQGFMQHNVSNGQVNSTPIQIEHSPRASTCPSTPDLFESDDYLFECLPDDELSQIARLRKSDLIEIKSTENSQITCDIEPQVLDDQLATTSINNDPSEVTNDVITLDAVLEHNALHEYGIYKVKIKFSRVVDKLMLVEDKSEYRLKIAAIDCTSGFETTVSLHSDLISKFIGYTPEDIKHLKEAMKTINNVAAKPAVLKALFVLKDKLMKLNNIVELAIQDSVVHPIMLNVLN